MKSIWHSLGICFVILLIAAGCGPARSGPAGQREVRHAGQGIETPAATLFAAQPIKTAIQAGPGLTQAEVETLSSLEKVSDYPLYTMRYAGVFPERRPATQGSSSTRRDREGWACSLFAALADPQGRMFGRNFDWRYSPALLLFTDPPGGYASVSMVDIGYLVEENQAGELDRLPLDERKALLEAPFWPFDGMNEHGLAIGMAAVPDQDLPYDPEKETIDSLRVMRQVLDQARNVDEAVEIVEEYNIDFGGGPFLHYLMADRSGRAVLVEFSQGKAVIIPEEAGWHAATNYLRSEAGDSPEGECWRYDRISRRMGETGGRLGSAEAMALLSEVAQDTTQWSVVYGMSWGEVTVAMGGRYEEVFTFPMR